MISTIAILFIPIFLGYLLVKLKYLDVSISKYLKLFVVRIAVPCRIFISIIDLNFDTLKQIIPMTLSFLLLTTIIIILSFLLIRIKDKKVKAAYMISIVFGNYGFMGWAVLDGAMGAEGMSRGIFFTTLWWPVIYLGTFIIGKLIHIDSNMDVKTYRINMIIPSAVLILGIIVNLLNIPIYEPLLNTLASFSNMTVTLILFSSGLTISFSQSYKNLKQAIIPVILRPVIGLCAALVVVSIMNFSDPISRNTVLIESTMPVAVMSVILGNMLGLDDELTSSIFILSTLLSLITIPLALMLLL